MSQDIIHQLDILELVPRARAEELISKETHIRDITEAVIGQGDESLRVHAKSCDLADQIAAHLQSESGAAESILYAAEQLKLHHLDLLDRYFDSIHHLAAEPELCAPL